MRFTDNRRMFVFLLMIRKIQKAQILRWLSVGCCLILAISLVGFENCVAIGMHSKPVHAEETATTKLGKARGCVAAWKWPLKARSKSGQIVIAEFDNPVEPWLPGHRGVDLAADLGAPIVAPSQGQLSFAGVVAGKQVVSLRIDNFTVTFEPAVTGLKADTVVESGQEFARFEGHSDHCDGRCLHWGVKTAQQTYMNPLSKVKPRKIILKPE